MQPVADLRFLELTEESVEPPQRRVVIVGERDIAIEPGIAGEIEDASRQIAQPSPVQSRCRVVLIEQRLEVLQWSIGLGPRQRRHQMVDDHRPGAALCLRPLAGVVDDEWI